jgi:hypothetical protein
MVIFTASGKGKPMDLQYPSRYLGRRGEIDVGYCEQSIRGRRSKMEKNGRA